MNRYGFSDVLQDAQTRFNNARREHPIMSYDDQFNVTERSHDYIRLLQTMEEMLRTLDDSADHIRSLLSVLREDDPIATLVKEKLQYGHIPTEQAQQFLDSTFVFDL